MECDFCPGKNSKTAVFACEKDYQRHILTKSHKDRVLARKMENDRRKKLDDLDEKAEAKAGGAQPMERAMNGVKEEGTDEEDWEDDDESGEDCEMEEDEE